MCHADQTAAVGALQKREVAVPNSWKWATGALDENVQEVKYKYMSS